MTRFLRRGQPAWSGYLATVAAIAVLARVSAGAANESVSRINQCRIGFGGVYKVGHWTPLSVELSTDSSLGDLQIDVTADDSDGVPATASTTVSPRTNANQSTSELVTRVGRMGGRVSVVLKSEGTVVDRTDVAPALLDSQDETVVNLPATGELFVAVGTAPFGWQEAFAVRDSSDGQVVRRAVQLTRVVELPTTWFGYEAVDVLVLSVGDGVLVRELAADSARLAALRQWVELGGRLVILCGGEASQDLFLAGQPLADLLPAKLAGVARLPQTGALEHFSQSSAQIVAERGSAELRVPQFVDVTGQIEVFAGQRPSDLPLVIRGVHGLGEVAVAGVDLSTAPLATWPGRTAFLQALLRPHTAKEMSSDAPQSLMSLGYNDLSGALRQRLGNSFANVTTLTFPTVASLAIAYLLVLGPGDYWLVHKVLRRPEAAWITFPTLVIATSLGAYALAGWSRGATSPRVNQVQLIDFDVAAGRARGTYWAVAYSPDSRRYDARLSDGHDDGIQETLVSNWGLTGAGIGGMDGRSTGLSVTGEGYRFSPSLDALLGVPLLTNSTKSFLGRWVARTGPTIEGRLTVEDELPKGTITNRTGGRLKNARLLYGTWAFRLGDLEDGQQVELGPHLDALQVSTLVARSAGIAADQLSGEAARATFYSDRASTSELLNLMMFYEAAGGQAFAQLPNRYQAYCDLSRLLHLGRAILVAESPDPGRQLQDGASAFGASGGTALVVVRYVLPVESKE